MGFRQNIVIEFMIVSIYRVLLYFLRIQCGITMEFLTWVHHQVLQKKHVKLSVAPPINPKLRVQQHGIAQVLLLSNVIV